VLWLHILAQGPSSVSPIDSATDSLIGEVCSYGLLGILTLAVCFLWYRGWRLVPPGFETTVRGAARMDARADLIAERDRIIAEKREVEEQRDAAMQVASSQLVPLLVSFTATTQALLPLLQTLVGQGGRQQLRRGDQKW
jgi:hypothetical protein